MPTEKFDFTEEAPDQGAIAFLPDEEVAKFAITAPQEVAGTVMRTLTDPAVGASAEAGREYAGRERAAEKILTRPMGGGVLDMPYVGPETAGQLRSAAGAVGRAIEAPLAGMARAATQIVNPVTFLPEEEQAQLRPFVISERDRAPGQPAELRPMTRQEAEARAPFQPGVPLLPVRGTELQPEGSDMERLLSQNSTPGAIAMIAGGGVSKVIGGALLASMVPGVVEDIADVAGGPGSMDEKRERINQLILPALLALRHGGGFKPGEAIRDLPPPIRRGIQPVPDARGRFVTPEGERRILAPELIDQPAVPGPLPLTGAELVGRPEGFTPAVPTAGPVELGPAAPPRVRRPEVPEGGEVQARESMLEEIRRKDARTREQIRQVFPDLTREQAAELRNAVWGKPGADVGVEVSPTVPRPEPMSPIKPTVKAPEAPPDEFAAQQEARRAEEARQAAIDRSNLEQGIITQQRLLEDALAKGDVRGQEDATRKLMQLRKAYEGAPAPVKAPIEPKAPTPRLPRGTFAPEVPETPAQPQEPILAEIRRRNLKTKEEIRQAFPGLNRERAAELRDQAWAPPVVRDVPPGSVDPNSIVPAIRLIGGKVVQGQPGETHPDIILREGIKAEDIDQRGFSDPTGQKFFLDREAAAKGTLAPTAREPGRLHSTDLPAAKGPEEPPAEAGPAVTAPKPEPPKPAAPAAGQFAKESGVTFDGEDLGGIQMPPNIEELPPKEQATYRKLAENAKWAFTDRRPDSPTKGVTFYVKKGSTAEEIHTAWEAKKAEFEGTPTPGAAPSTEIAAPSAPTGIEGTVIAGKTLAEWEAVTTTAGLPKGEARAELAKWLAVPNQPSRILQALANKKRTREIHAPPPTEVAPVEPEAEELPKNPKAEVAMRKGVIRRMEFLAKDNPEQAEAAQAEIERQKAKISELEKRIAAETATAPPVSATKPAEPAPKAPTPATKAEAAAPADSPQARLSKAFDDWDTGETTDTERDLLQKVEDEIADNPDAIPEPLKKAAEEYRQALKEDFEEHAGRGDVEPFAQDFINELESFTAKRAEPAAKGAAEPTAETGKEFPVANQHGVYSKEEAEHFGYPTTNKDRTKAEVFVMEVAPGKWIQSVGYDLYPGGMSSPLTTNRTFPSRFDAALSGFSELYANLASNRRGGGGEATRQARLLKAVKWLVSEFDKQFPGNRQKLMDATRAIMKRWREDPGSALIAAGETAEAEPAKGKGKKVEAPPQVSTTEPTRPKVTAPTPAEPTPEPPAAAAHPLEAVLAELGIQGKGKVTPAGIFVTPGLTKAQYNEMIAAADKAGWSSDGYTQKGKGPIYGEFRKKLEGADLEIAKKRSRIGRLNAIVEMDPTQAEAAKAEIAKEEAAIAELEKGAAKPAEPTAPKAEERDPRLNPEMGDVIDHPDFGRVEVKFVVGDRVRFEILSGKKRGKFSTLPLKEWREDLTGKAEPAPEPGAPDPRRAALTEAGLDAFDLDRLAKITGMSQDQWLDQSTIDKNHDAAIYSADKPRLLAMEEAIDNQDVAKVKSLYAGSFPPDHFVRRLFEAITKTKHPQDWADSLKKAEPAPKTEAAIPPDLLKQRADLKKEGERLIEEARKTKQEQYSPEQMRRLNALQAEAQKIDEQLRLVENRMFDLRWQAETDQFRGQVEPPPSEPKVTGKELKAQKENLLGQIDQAIKEAPDVATKVDETPRITISVPGDGEFKIYNTKEALRKFRDVAKTFPATVEKYSPPKISEFPTTTRSAKPTTIPAAAEPKAADRNKLLGRVTSEDPSREGMLTVYSDGTQMISTDGRRMIRYIGKDMPGTPAEPVRLSPDGKPQKETSNYPNYNTILSGTPRLVLGGMDTANFWHVAHQANTFNKTFGDKGGRTELYLNPDKTLGAKLEAQGDSFEHNVQKGSKFLGSYNPEYLFDMADTARRLGDAKADLYVDGEEGPLELVGKNHQHLLMAMKLTDDPKRVNPTSIPATLSGKPEHVRPAPGLPPLRNPEAAITEKVGPYRVTLEGGEFLIEKPAATKYESDLEVTRVPLGDQNRGDLAKALSKFHGEEITPNDKRVANLLNAAGNLAKEREGILEEGRQRLKGLKLPPGLSEGPGAASPAEFGRDRPSPEGIDTGDDMWNRAIRHFDNFLDGMRQLFTRSGYKQEFSQLANAADNIPRWIGQTKGNALRIRMEKGQGRAVTFIMQALKMSGDGLDVEDAARLGELQFQGDPLGYLRTKQADLETKAQEFLAKGQKLEATAAKEAAEAMALAQKQYNTLLPIARRAKAMLDAQWAREQRHGIPVDYERWYVPQRHDLDLLTSADKPIVLGHSRGAGAATGFKKAKFYEDYATAIENGFIPRSTDIADLVEHRVFQGERLIERKALFRQLARYNDPTDGKPIVTRIPRRVIHRPDGTIDVQETTPIGYEIHEVTPGDRVAIHSGYARLLRALTGSSQLAESAPVGALSDMAAIQKHISLAIDTFHASRTLQAEAALTGKMSIGERQKRGLALVEYRPQDLNLAAQKGLISQEMADWVQKPQEIQLGGRTVRLSPHSMITLGARNGLNMARVADVMYRDWIRELPIIGDVQKWVFDKMTRSAISLSFLHEFERVARANPHLNAGQVARAVSSDINTFFGNLGKESIFKNPSLRTMNNILFLAPQWVEALARREARAVKQAGQTVIGAFKGEPIRVGTAAKGIGTGLAAYFVATQLVNLWTRGHLTFQNPEEGHKLDAFIPSFVPGDKNGTFISPLSVFGEIMHDILRYSHDKPDIATAIAQIGENKFGNVGRFFQVLALGRDPVTNEKLIGSGRRAIKAGMQLVPVPIISSQGIKTGQAYLFPGKVQPPAPGALQRQLLASAGLKTEIEQGPGMQVRRMADAWKRSSKNPTIRAQVERRLKEDFGPSDYRDLRTSLARGDLRAAEAAYVDLLETKKPEDIRKTMAHPHPFTGSANMEAVFRSQLTPEQMRTYRAAIAEREQLNKKFHDMLRDYYRRQRAR
jgi:hypothetical protein